MPAESVAHPASPETLGAASPARRAAHLGLGLVAPALLLLYNLQRAATLTIDDSYVSFRYARNLVNGHGLVYNVGERIEGYTNFLWTLLAALGMALGVDPHATTKVLGGAAALGTLALAYRLAGRLQPYGRLPCLATWLLASSMVFAGHAVAGLETQLFVFLVVLGVERVERERTRPAGFPISGVVFGLAGLTRPEAPMFLGITMLFLGRGFVGRQNLIRGAVFVAIVGAHVAFRRAYYGTWLPNTLGAKTGDLHVQLALGLDYVGGYFLHNGFALAAGVLGLAQAVVRRERLGLLLATLAIAVLGYVILVGGDWMPLFRFLAPFEPFAFVLVDVALRRVGESDDRATLGTLAIFLLAVGAHRAREMDERAERLALEARAWDETAHVLGDRIAERGPRGVIALGDIGYVGWVTDYPILDVLGLVDPVIGRLPGAYTRKQGPRYRDYFFGRMPRYFILNSHGGDCAHPFHPAHVDLYEDPRFAGAYEPIQRVGSSEGGWCLFEHRPSATRERVVFDFEQGYAGWTATGEAFAQGPSTAMPENQQPLEGVVGERAANSFDPVLRDGARGTLTSAPFALDRQRLGLRVGGGMLDTTRVELLVDDRVVRSTLGPESETLERVVWDVRPWRGRQAQLRLVDEESGPFGHVVVDDVVLFDQDD